MIYDCFPFFNELDVLEIRLKELADVVDRFVIVEATKTFQKKDKPLYFAENRDLFREYDDKIIHVVVDRYPGFFHRLRVPTAWDYSNHQKNMVAEGLKDCQEDDVVIISDLDEIPRADQVLKYSQEKGIKVFEQRHFNFFLNCAAVDGPDARHLRKYSGLLYWRGSVMMNYRDFRNFKQARLQRDRVGDDILDIPEGGWHFSFLGDWQQVAYKLEAWEHASEAHYSPEYLQNPENLRRIIESGEDLFGREFQFRFVKIDKTYPRYVQENLKRFSKYIR